MGSTLVELKGQGSQAVIPVNSSNTDTVITKSAAVASLHEVENFGVICDSEAADAMGPPTQCVRGENAGVCNWPEPLLKLDQQSTGLVNLLITNSDNCMHF